ncbi:protein TIC 21, chloroplastic-like [Oryza glaberrima]|uniref:Translocon at inner membrane of chloroplasts 21 n=2 Tax=Oryza TaxID=4527 RepID=A0A0D3F1R1_9ORYZ|nr:protein TIC 21, chloroplastic-like [Oryza glaberrima]
MQAALLLPARPSAAAPPTLLRRGVASASSARAPTPLPAGRLSGGVLSAVRRLTVAAAGSSSSSSGPLYPTPPPTEQDIERAKFEQVVKRLGKTARYFKNLGTLGFWSQLVSTVVSAGILSFSTVITGKVTAPFTFYATAAGIAAGFISVFWSFGYIRLSERLRKTASEPAKAPPRADVIRSLKNGIVLNMLGMGAAVLGMQATVGALVAKALTTSAVPYYQATSPGQSPVLALDVFLVQASANIILSHFLGLASSLELLRSVAIPPAEAAAA